MTLTELLELKNRAATSTGWTVRMRVDQFEYPFYDIKTKTSSFAIANAWLLAQDTETHTVVVAVRYDEKTREKSYNIWCGDKFLEGTLMPKGNEDPVQERCAQAAAGLDNEETLIIELQAAAGQFKISDSCSFWELWRQKPRRLCIHTDHVLAELVTEDLLDRMEAKLDAKLGITPAAAPLSVRSTSPLLRFLFRVPVLIEGDRGSGKTTEVHSIAKSEAYHFVKIGGHEGIEASDLLGHMVPTNDKTLVWKDGGLSEAFRKASKGIKTLLLVDEMLRIPQRQLSVLLTPLSDFEGVYELRTGRIVNIEDGVGEEEVLRCKLEHLAVVATTNVGAEYAVDDIDPALAERWVILRKDTTVEALKGILTDAVKTRGFGTGVVPKLITFFNRLQDLKRGGQIGRTPTTRTLVRAVKLAAKESEIKDYLLDQALLWVERDTDGYPNAQQLEMLNKATATVFAGSRP